jgi:chitin synthase
VRIGELPLSLPRWRKGTNDFFLRYIALQNDSTGTGPLQKYFLGEKMHGAGADIFTANMYLAEDRILCWELVSKRGGSWILHYVKSAYAITDVPDQVSFLFVLER